MQDRNADGCILIGPPGAAKSLVAKATGNTARIPTIAFDLGAMQNALVGASGERLRAALKVVDAVTNGRSLWIATCNSIGTLAPELRRRFTLGTFFFDLPSPEERAAIWKIYVAKYGASGDLPDDEGWTGAEIKECCRKAYRLKLTLKESAEYIVPVSRFSGGSGQGAPATGLREVHQRVLPWRVSVPGVHAGTTRGTRVSEHGSMSWSPERRLLAASQKLLTAPLVRIARRWAWRLSRFP